MREVKASVCLQECKCTEAFFVARKRKEMKAYVMDMTIPDIQCECLCSPSMASAARSETVMLINKTDLSECLRERQVICNTS